MQLTKPGVTEEDVEDAQRQLAAVKINYTGEVDKLQVKQRAALEREISRIKSRDNSYSSPPNSAGLHPDLQDLNFNELGNSHG